MRLADERLQKLTNEFIKNFFEMAHDICIENAKGKHPATHCSKRNDSFEFNYTLAECIANSDFAVIEAQKREDYPLIGSGFPANIVKGIFANAVKGIKEDVEFVVANFDKQDDDLDYFVRDLKETSDVKNVKNVNIDFVLTGKGEAYVMEDETHRKASFTVHNTKSGYVGTCEVFYVDGEFKELRVSGKGGTHLEVNRNEEPTITHFRHVADINSFFLMIEQVKYGIEDTLKEQ